MDTKQNLIGVAYMIIAAKRGFHDYRCQGYVPLTLDVMRVAFKVPLAFHTPL